MACYYCNLSFLSVYQSSQWYCFFGINFLEVDGYLNLIDGGSAVAGIFGADFVFDMPLVPIMPTKINDM